MSIYRDKKSGCFVFDFSRTIEGRRVRATKVLPRTWTRSQADKFDHQESARLYAAATRVGGVEHLIDDAVNLYVTERCPQLKHGRDYARELQEMLPWYEGRTLSQLPDVCKDIRTKAKKKGENPAPLAPATITNRIRYLTAACRYAWRFHSMGTTDPAAGVVTPEVDNERSVFITRQQMLQLARACKDRPTRAVIRIAFYSGMRLGEILRAEVSGTAFVLRDTKNGEPRIVPIHPKIRCCLGYAWPTRFILSYQFRKARVIAKMPDLHIHDLRHSSASAMINAGVDLYTVGTVLGHKSHASTKRYAHLATDALKVAIDKIGKLAA